MEESFRQELMCPLSVEEMNGYSGQLARATAKQISLRERKAATATEFNAQIKDLGIEIRELAVKINEGYERRLVDVRWEYDWDEGRKQMRRLDSMELVIGQTDVAITQEERQRMLFAKGEGKVIDMAKKPGEDGSQTL